MCTYEPSWAPDSTGIRFRHTGCPACLHQGLLQQFAKGFQTPVEVRTHNSTGCCCHSLQRLPVCAVACSVRTNTKRMFPCTATARLSTTLLGHQQQAQPELWGISACAYNTCVQPTQGTSMPTCTALHLECSTQCSTVWQKAQAADKPTGPNSQQEGHSIPQQTERCAAQKQARQNC